MVYRVLGRQHRHATFGRDVLHGRRGEVTQHLDSIAFMSLHVEGLSDLRRGEVDSLYAVSLCNRLPVVEGIEVAVRAVGKTLDLGKLNRYGVMR